MYWDVKVVRPLSDYCLFLELANGSSGIFDVKPYLHGSAFRELVDESYFRLVRPAHYGIAWPNEQDFSYDTIYLGYSKYLTKMGNSHNKYN